MTCDICNSAMESPSCLLGTKEVVTSKDCWTLYLRGLIADKVINPEVLQKSLPGLIGQMACSDTPWALCATCTASLKEAGFAFRRSDDAVPARGHALCRSTKPMEVVVMDEVSVAKAQQAARMAAAAILARGK